MTMPIWSTGTTPKKSRGTTFTGERTDRCAWAPRSTRSIACSQAEFPKPTTRTGRPFQASPLRYSLECSTCPRKSAMPGQVGRTGVRAAPVATTTDRARHSRSGVVATHASSRRSRRVTGWPYRGSRPWWSR